MTSKPSLWFCPFHAGFALCPEKGKEGDIPRIVKNSLRKRKGVASVKVRTSRSGNKEWVVTLSSEVKRSPDKIEQLMHNLTPLFADFETSYRIGSSEKTDLKTWATTVYQSCLA